MVSEVGMMGMTMWLGKVGRADVCEVQKPRKQGLDGAGVMRS
jgi:hypothetical protein